MKVYLAIKYHPDNQNQAILKDVKLGTTVHSIVSEILFNFPIPLPSSNTQLLLVAQMQTKQAQAHTLRAQAAQLRQSARRELEVVLTHSELAEMKALAQEVAANWTSPQSGVDLIEEQRR